jgi:hypothetical protein
MRGARSHYPQAQHSLERLGSLKNARPANSEPFLRHCAYPAPLPTSLEGQPRPQPLPRSLGPDTLLWAQKSLLVDPWPSFPSSWSSFIAVLVLVSSTTNLALVGLVVGGADTVEPIAGVLELPSWTITRYVIAITACALAGTRLFERARLVLFGHVSRSLLKFTVVIKVSARSVSREAFVVEPWNSII